MKPRPYRVYKRVLGDCLYVSSHYTFSEAETVARRVGGYVVARKQVWHETADASALSNPLDTPSA